MRTAFQKLKDRRGIGLEMAMFTFLTLFGLSLVIMTASTLMIHRDRNSNAAFDRRFDVETVAQYIMQMINYEEQVTVIDGSEFVLRDKGTIRSYSYAISSEDNVFTCTISKNDSQLLTFSFLKGDTPQITSWHYYP